MPVPISAPIVTIVIDDLQGLGELEDYGVPLEVVAPNLARYRDEWAYFSDAHCSVPACRPSRHAMWSGVAGHRTGRISNRDVLPRVPFIMDRLRESGVRVIGAGKVFHGRKLAEQPSNVWHRYEEEIIPVPTLNTLPEIQPFGGFGESYQEQPDDELVRRLICSKILRNLGTKSQGTNWARKALFVGLLKPHLPFVVYPEYFDLIPAGSVRPPSTSASVPEAGTLASSFRTKSPTVDTLVAQGKLDDAIHAYLACVRFVDKQVGRIVSEVPENSHIIIVSDNGYSLGEKGMFAKFAPWSQCTRVPLLVRSPSVPNGSGDPVSTVEVHNMILAMNEGRRWVKTHVPTSSIRDDWNTGAPESASGTTAIASRTRDWTLIRYTNGSRVEHELYSASDVEQLSNVYSMFVNLPINIDLGA